MRNRYIVPMTFWLILALGMTACTPGDDPPSEPASESTSPTPNPTMPPTAEIAPSSPTVPTPMLLPPEEPPRGAEREFSTDFSLHTISFSEILSGGPPKDGIPAIDDPRFVSIAEADTWLGEMEPVTVLQVQDDVRIYPYQILMWHEIVNDTVGGRSVVITFCPLCNTAIVFDAAVDGLSLDFGTTGRLRFSNLLMYDRQTESWWQQASGDAVIGELTGSRLALLPSYIISWEKAKTQYPEAIVLSQETGYNRRYGHNPYIGYDSITNSPFLFTGETPDQLPAMARVTTVELDGEAVAYPNHLLQELRVVNDTVANTEVVVFWQPGLASALDSSVIAAGQDVGASGVFERTVDGQPLTFAANNDQITDEQTNSVWTIFGEAIDGELVGKSLTPVVKIDHFWFSWAAFRPDTRIYQPK